MEDSDYPRPGRSPPGIAGVTLTRSLRITLLVVLAYALGFAGVVAAVFADGASDGGGTAMTVGIGLMGLSFVCLFVVSVTIMEVGGADDR